MDFLYIMGAIFFGISIIAFFVYYVYNVFKDNNTIEYRSTEDFYRSQNDNDIECTKARKKK